MLRTNYTAHLFITLRTNYTQECQTAHTSPFHNAAHFILLRIEQAGAVSRGGGEGGAAAVAAAPAPRLPPSLTQCSTQSRYRLGRLCVRACV